MKTDIYHEDSNWSSFVMNATLSNLLWLHYKPFKCLSLCNEIVADEVMIRPDFTLTTQLYAQAADSWLKNQANSQLYCYCDRPPQLFPSASNHLEILADNDGYTIKLVGAWEHEVSLCLWLAKSDLIMIEKDPAQVGIHVYWKFIQLNIMLASLFNLNYLELLRGSHDYYLLEMILPNWELKADSSLEVLKAKFLKLSKNIPSFIPE